MARLHQADFEFYLLGPEIPPCSALELFLSFKVTICGRHQTVRVETSHRLRGRKLFSGSIRAISVEYRSSLLKNPQELLGLRDWLTAIPQARYWPGESTNSERYFQLQVQPLLSIVFAHLLLLFVFPYAFVLNSCYEQKGEKTVERVCRRLARIEICIMHEILISTLRVNRRPATDARLDKQHA